MCIRTILVLAAAAFAGSAPTSRVSADPNPPDSTAGADCCHAARGACCSKALTPNTTAAPGPALSDGERSALTKAIQDEYKARATYAKVIDTFGEVMPFANIVHAESRHIGALTQLFNRYGVDVPRDEWYDKVPAYASVRDACAAAVQAEIENAALYDEIGVDVRQPDIARVFTALRAASIEHHLPAFKRCAEGNRGQGRQGQRGGYGRGSGNGRGYRGGRS